MIDNTRFWITTSVAIAALMLSILNSYWQWRQWRPHLVVTATLRPAALPLPSSTHPGNASREVPCLVVHVANPSDKAAHVTVVRLRLPGRKSIELGEHHAMYGELNRPFSVEAWGGHDVYVRGKTFLDKLLRESFQGRVVASVEAEDELGRIYRSRTFALQFEQLQEAPEVAEASAA